MSEWAKKNPHTQDAHSSFTSINKLNGGIKEITHLDNHFCLPIIFVYLTCRYHMYHSSTALYKMVRGSGRVKVMNKDSKFLLCKNQIPGFFFRIVNLTFFFSNFPKRPYLFHSPVTNKEDKYALKVYIVKPVGIKAQFVLLGIFFWHVCLVVFNRFLSNLFWGFWGMILFNFDQNVVFRVIPHFHGFHGNSTTWKILVFGHE